MPERVRVQFYTVEKCGYYDDGDTHQFCHFPDMLSHIDEWAHRPGQRLRQLKTFQCSIEADPPTVYLLGLWNDAATGDYLMATWNETPNTGGATSSLRGDNEFGQAVVDSTSHPAGNISGYPTYFWMLPQRGVFATIKTESEVVPHNGHRGLSRFLSGFLARYSPHVAQSAPVQSPGAVEVEVSGYRHHPAAPAQSLEACFESRPARRPGPLTEIRHQRETITKIVYRHKLRTSELLSRRMFQKFLIWITGSKPPPFEHSTNFKAEMLFRPTADELEKVIAKWRQSPEDNWNNVGFKLRGRSGILWLSGIFVKSTPRLTVNRIQGVIDGENLLAQLVQNRAQLVLPLSETAP